MAGPLNRPDGRTSDPKAALQRTTGEDAADRRARVPRRWSLWKLRREMLWDAEFENAL